MDSITNIRRQMDEEMARAKSVVLREEIIGLGNPYLDTVIDLASLEALTDPWSFHSGPLLYARHRLVEHYAWAIPNDEALAIVGQTGKVVEVGAGGGYWAALLRARGVEVHAYDPASGKTQWNKKVWTEVRRGWTKPASDHPDATLFLCWPSYTSSFARIALQRYLLAGGKRLVYIGEHEGGCCTDDDFFEALGERMVEVGSLGIPMYPGLHDYLTVWEPKSTAGGKKSTKERKP